MKLAMRLPAKNGSAAVNDTDPRDGENAEIIDLASRTAYPAVAGRKGGSDAAGLIGGIAVVALIGAATLWGLSAGDSDPAQPVAATEAPPVAAFDPAPVDVTIAQPVIAPQAVADPAPSAILSQPVAQPGAFTNPYSSPTLVFDSSAALNGSNAAAVKTTDAVAAQPTVPGGGAAGEFASRLGGVGGAPATARSDLNPATTVAQGTIIPAILETAINTDVPGYVRAVVSQDVRSFDGRRVLVPRSSRLVGQYQSGLQAGQKRAYVIWTRVIRPDGVSVNLASPATSFDGTAGLEGKVNNHFFSRFGSAMLLSVIDGLATIATGGASVVLGGGQSAASTALEQDGQRSPTVRVGMGEPVRVFTARDLDFSQAPLVR